MLGTGRAQEEGETAAQPSRGAGLRKALVSTHSHSRSELEKFSCVRQAGKQRPRKRKELSPVTEQNCGDSAKGEPS